MRWLVLLLPWLVAGCLMSARPLTWPQSRSVDVAVIPGCPSEADGSLSRCQWERVIWGAELWKDGVADNFIVSGNAVHNRYIEAEALEAGLVSLGVPAERIHIEPLALHSDENGAYSLALAESLGFETIGVASHTVHANGIKALIRAWGHRHVYTLEMSWVLVQMRLRKGVPEVRTEPVPSDRWMPLAERERLLAERAEARRRPPSLLVYPVTAIRGWFGTAPRPLPPAY